jgi:hydroxymethylbilane synthase
LDASVSLPAIGQGALGLECRVDDARTHALIATLDHRATHLCVAAERAFLERLEGGCQVPIAAHATLAPDADGRELLRLEGLVASVDGARLIREQLAGPPADGPAMGRRLAERILDRGGGEILREVYAGG